MFTAMALDKQRVATALARYGLNPFVKAGAAVGVGLPGVVIVETRGRRSGKRRRTPVGGRVEGGVVWIVAEHGRRAGWVRNAEANRTIRIKRGLRWRTGVATILPEDDWRERLRAIGRGRPGLKLNSTVVRMMKTEPVTVRVDLDT
jgi:deazaflavin-dependent oxidoreductase (nitroreductase family)